MSSNANTRTGSTARSAAGDNGTLIRGRVYVSRKDEEENAKSRGPLGSVNGYAPHKYAYSSPSLTHESTKATEGAATEGQGSTTESAN